jgi:hypothetical protein
MGGRIKFWGLMCLIHLSQIRILYTIPILGLLINMAHSLLIAYEVEEENGLLQEKTFNTREALQLSSFENLDIKSIYDYIVIGTGPGSASIVDLIPENASVLVLERGMAPKTPLSLHHTLSHVINDFTSAGQELIFSKNFPQYAQGSVLGGGSEVNSGLYHKLPLAKKQKFVDSLGIAERDWDLQESFVEKLLRVEVTSASEVNSIIYRGAKTLGLESRNIPRWRHYFSSTDFVHFGMNSLIWDNFFTTKNRKLLTGCTAQKIKYISESLAEVNLTQKNGSSRTVKGSKIILAAGTIETPYLLAKSGLISWGDTRFQWHPMHRAVVEAQISDLGKGDIDPYQAWTSDYSLKFGSAVSTPGLLALSLKRKVSSMEIERMRSIYVSYVSTGRGGLIPRTRIPWYTHSSLDKKLARTGSAMLVELINASGVKLIGNPATISAKSSTVHIFGSLPANSGIFHAGTSTLKKYENISVCDGSLLPFGPGVNPQAVIMTTTRALYKRSL